MTDMMRLSLPMTLWLVSFSAVYGLHALTCANGWSQNVLIVGAVVAVALQTLPLALLSARFGGTTPFLRRASITLAIVGVVAAVWTLLPVAFLPACH